MAEKVYWNGQMVSVEDWDYKTKRPKIKLDEKAVIAEAESQSEVVTEESEEITE